MTVFLNCHIIISQLGNSPQSCECCGASLVRLRLGCSLDGTPGWPSSGEQTSPLHLC